MKSKINDQTDLADFIEAGKKHWKLVLSIASVATLASFVFNVWRATRHNVFSINLIEHQFSSDFMGLAGILLGAAALTIGVVIASKTDKKIDEALDLNYLKNLPEIIDAAIKMLSDTYVLVQNNNAEACAWIMNYTSGFGYAHTFNKQFLREVKLSIIDSFITSDLRLKRKADVLLGKVEKHSSAVATASINFTSFNLITYKGSPDEENSLTNFFLRPYLSLYNDLGDFCDCERAKSYVKSDLDCNDLEQFRKIVTAATVKYHNSTLQRVEKSEKSQVSEVEFLLPFQMYLVQTAQNNKHTFKTLLIYAVDEEGDKGAIRSLHAFSSKKEDVFKMCLSMFNNVKI